LDEGSPYILGDIFLKEFYSIYDFETNKVGIALHRYSEATVGTHTGKLIFWIIVIVSVIIALAIIGVCLC